MKLLKQIREWSHSPLLWVVPQAQTVP